MNRVVWNKVTFALTLLIMASGFSACFKDPITGPVVEVPDAKPFAVSVDSMSYALADNDDVVSGPHHRFVLSNRAVVGRTNDSSSIVIDTSKAIPTLSTKLYFTPVFQDQSDMKESRLRQVYIALDSFPITGDDWCLVNDGQIAFVVRTVEKPTQQYSRVHIEQSSKGPYSKDDSFARILSWKLTAKREIVLQIEMQAAYTVTSMSRQGRDRIHAIAELRIRY